MDVRKGDLIEIPSNKVDQPARRGTVTAVVRDEPLTLEVAWDDGRTSRLQPAGGTLRVLQQGDR